MGWGGKKKEGGGVCREKRKRGEKKGSNTTEDKKKKTTGVFDVNWHWQPVLLETTVLFFRLGAAVKRAWQKLGGQDGCNAGA